MADLAGNGRKVKRFRVARKGQTVDGRSLSCQEILEMAQSYNPTTYAGRINVKHLISFSPEPPFNAYGDILKGHEGYDQNQPVKISYKS